MFSSYFSGADLIEMRPLSVAFIVLSIMCAAVVVACVCRLNKAYPSTPKFLAKVLTYNACSAIALWVFCDMMHGEATIRDAVTVAMIAACLIISGLPLKKRGVYARKTKTCANHATA